MVAYIFRGFLSGSYFTDCEVQPTSSRPQLLAAVQVALLLSDESQIEWASSTEAGFQLPSSTFNRLLALSGDMECACAAESAPKFHS